MNHWCEYESHAGFRKLLVSAKNVLELLGTFDVSSAERQRGAPLAYQPPTGIAPCDDSQARGVLWGSKCFPATLLIPLSCVLTSVHRAASAEAISTALFAINMHFAPGTDVVDQADAIPVSTRWPPDAAPKGRATAATYNSARESARRSSVAAT